MVNPIYDEMRGVAQNLFSEFDQGGVEYVLTIPAVGGTADDPGEPQVSYKPINSTVKGVGFQYVQSGLAVAGQMQLTMPVPADYTPDMNGSIRLGGAKVYKLTQVLPKPVTNPVVYVLIFGDGDLKALRRQYA